MNRIGLGRWEVHSVKGLRDNVVDEKPLYHVDDLLDATATRRGITVGQRREPARTGVERERLPHEEMIARAPSGCRQPPAHNRRRTARKVPECNSRGRCPGPSSATESVSGVRSTFRCCNVLSMTTLPDRPNAALLVIDMQNNVVARSPNRDEAISNIRDLVDRARTAGVDVVWVQHHDDELVLETDEWRLVPELSPGEAEPLVHKSHGDSFEATTLEAVLAARGVGKLYVTGAQTDACVRATLHGAFVRGYDVTLVSDAHATEDLSPYGAPPPDQVVAHTNLYWQFQTAPGRLAEVASTSAIEF